MECKDINACFSEIDAYCSGEETGHVLLVNTQNYDMYQTIQSRLQADQSKHCVLVSEHCAANGLPNLDDICALVTGTGDYVLIGISQAAMLRSAGTLHETIGKLLELPVRGHAVVLFDHSAAHIREYMAQSKKVDRKVVLLESQESILPRIRIAHDQIECIGVQPIQGMKRLQAYMEKLTDMRVRENPEVTVMAPFSPTLFKDAAYSVSACDNIYLSIAKKYPDIAAGTTEAYGTDEQWRRLASLLQKEGSLFAVSSREFGSVSDYGLIIGKVWNTGDFFRMWLLWLAMKVFGAQGNKYLSYAVRNSEKVEDFESHLYRDLLEIDSDDVEFDRYYEERKELIIDMPENLTLIDSYCSMVGMREKQAVYYLTDTSNKEKYEFMNCLSMYDYTEEELLKITKNNFRMLYLYLLPFRFSAANTKLADKDAGLRDELTDYFRKYKIQKITNRIWPEFLSQVEGYAQTRPYNKLQVRSSIINKLPKTTKETSQLYFFDALGVEYLSYISAKCEEYGLVMELSIAHSMLPSITVKNKEFIQFFRSEVRKIDDLDELKHHSQVIDYTKCKIPVHLFSELSIIDEQLRQIQSQLVQGYFKEAVVVADHGASRLAVIRGEENSSSLELDEKAEHSGRCCPVSENPNIPFAAYEDGFAVLANYSRFKGGRKANVEVHGGATLEEVLVPIMIISRKPENIKICFVNPLVELHGKEVATITLFSNIPLQQPKLCVNGRFYEGTFVGDQKHAKFEMPELKRSRDCLADVYDGDKLLASKLPFRVQKSVAKDVLQL